MNIFVTVGVVLLYLCELNEIDAARVRSYHNYESGSVQPAFLPCSQPYLKNGIAKQRQRGHFIRFACNKGYEIYGAKYASCTKGRWDTEHPICIKKGCFIPDAPDMNTSIMPLHDGAILNLFCSTRYEAIGNQVSYCDGKKWDRTLGTCQLTNETAQKSCDFEGRSLCGWINDATHNTQWKWKNNNPNVLGPKFDHTSLKPFEGFFLIIHGMGGLEPIGARLISPIFEAKDSERACFRLFYHMFGSRTGTLRVYIKPSNMDITQMQSLPKFKLLELENDSKSFWREAVTQIGEFDGSFQIIIEGELEVGQTSDIAIDDVALLNGDECESEMQFSTAEPEEESTDFILAMQSCKGRCDEIQRNESVPVSASPGTQSCDCFLNCFDLGTCCPDYEGYCVEGGTVEDLEQTTTQTPPTTTTKTTTKTTTTTRKASKLKPVIPATDVEYVKDDPNIASETINSESKEEFQKLQVEEVSSKVHGGAIFGFVLLIALLVISAGGFLMYRHRESTNPENYKKNSQKKRNWENANGEFSEARYLTTDEDNIDFTPQIPKSED